MADGSYQTQTIPGIGIEVLMFWPVLVLVLKIPVSQVLVLVLKNWFCRNWYWYWYWPQRAFIPKPAEDTQMVSINPNWKFQTIQKSANALILPLYGGFKAFLKMLCCKIYSQYWYWYWGIGVLGLYWNWYWYWTFPYLGIGIGIGIELRPIWSIGIGIGIDLGPVGGIGIGIGLAKLVLSVSGHYSFQSLLKSLEKSTYAKMRPSFLYRSGTLFMFIM